MRLLSPSPVVIRTVLGLEAVAGLLEHLKLDLIGSPSENPLGLGFRVWGLGFRV